MSDVSETRPDSDPSASAPAVYPGGSSASAAAKSPRKPRRTGLSERAEQRAFRALTARGAVGIDAMRTACLLILAAATLLAGMYLLRGVLVPFVLALFFSLLLNPVIDLLVREMKWPRWMAVTAMFGAGALAILVLGLVLLPTVLRGMDQINAVGTPAPQTAVLDSVANADADPAALPSTLPADIGGPLTDATTRAAGENPPDTLQPIDTGDEKNDMESPGVYANAFNNGVANLADRLPNAVVSDETREAIRQSAWPWTRGYLFEAMLPAAGGMVRLFNSGLLIGIFLMFLLLGRSESPVDTQSLRGQIERRIQSYIAVTLLISALTGFGVGSVLWLLGVSFAWLFGAAAFVLNFIPNIGSAIATLLPLPIILFDPSLTPTVRVLAVLLPLAIQFGIGNVLAPKLLGDTLDLSPVAVLIGLILLGTIWQLPGMIVSTPLLVTVKIVCERIPLLAPVATALAGRLGQPTEDARVTDGDQPGSAAASPSAVPASATSPAGEAAPTGDAT